MHGIPLPEGLVESEKLSEPLFTPSTKAEQRAHDENISPEQGNPLSIRISVKLIFFPTIPGVKLIGKELYEEISSTALKLYTTAADYARTKGLILADTKFEFGLVPDEADTSKKTLILIDEALTPDSSRYWPLEGYKAGGPQPSFDKQFLRDWLVQSGFRRGLESGPEGKEGEGWTIDDSVLEGTRKRYTEAVELLTA